MRARFTRTRTRPLASRALPGQGPDQDPERIDRYVILRRLGVGGMGVVYEALDERVGRSVALKLMLASDAEVDRVRLRREAQALARLSHPNVVEVFEIGEHHDPDSGEPPRAYVAMELVDGHPLDRWLRLRRRSPAEIVQVFGQAGEGLAAAHAHGLVHRDFKPGNVLVGNDGRVRVVDFGLVRESDAIEPSSSAADGQSSAADSAADSAAGSASGSASGSAAGSAESLPQVSWSESLTKTGAMVGTPAYMSPEQLTNLPVGPASDQFSFCVAIFEALFGLHPFVVDGEWSKLPFNVLDGAVVRPPSERRVPGRLTKAVMRGLAVRPEQRWPSMDELLSELRHGLERRGPRPMLAALVVGAAALGLGVLANPTEANVPDRCEEASDIMGKAWGSEARDTIRTAWLGTGRQSDADTWSRIDTRMEAYANEWQAVHRAACSGTHRSPSSATCLARLAEGVHTRLQVMATPNDSLLDNAVQMISALPPVDRCRTILDDPSDAQVEDPPWRDDLDQVEALLKAGKTLDSRALVEELLARAEHEGNPRLSAEAKLRAAQVHLHTGEAERSAAMFEESYLEAKHLGRDRLAADAALGLLKLHGYGNVQESTRWARHARAEAERVGDPLLTSYVYNAWAQSLRGTNDLDTALDLHRQALAMQRSLPSIDEGEIAVTLFQIGTCLGLMGRAKESRKNLEQALRLQETLYGSKHPRVANTLTNLGLFDLLAGNNRKALASSERALAIATELDPDNPMAGWAARVNISEIHERDGRPLEAARVLRGLLDTAARSGQRARVDIVEVKWMEGQVALLENDLQTALTSFQQAVREHEADPTPGQMAGSNALQGLAKTLYRLGRFDEALVLQRRWLDEQPAEQGSSPNLLLRHEVLRGTLLLSTMLSTIGEHEAALEQLQRARGLLADRPNVHHLTTLDVLSGEALLELDRGADALPLLQAAVRRLEGLPASGDVELVPGLVALAEAELVTGDQAAAREHAERAVSLVEAQPNEHPELAARAGFVLARSLGSSREERVRALSLARQAEERWAAADAASIRDLEEVREWLEAQR